MNWDAIGAIAELLGAVGVIASLVYLAIQIRHSREQMSENTRAIRAGAYQGFLGNMMSVNTPIGHDAETSEIIRRGMEGKEELSEADAFRFNWLMSGILSNFDNAYYQFRNGMLSPDRWQIQAEVLQWFCMAPGIRTYWDTYTQSTLSPDFVRLVDERLQGLEEGEP